MKKGWGFPYRSTKAHYYVDHQSLCNESAYFEDELEDFNDRSPDNCFKRRKKPKILGRKKPLTIGIDPGLTGSMAVVNMDTMRLEYLFDIPTFKKETKARRQGYFQMVDIHAFAMLVDSVARDTALAVIEDPGAAPNQGLSSTFRFGQVCGQLHGALAGNYITTIPVKPTVWKSALGLCQSKTASLEKVKMLFPGSRDQFRLKKHHDRAEAVLLAFYGIKHLTKIIEAIRK